jgi:hypothetical protein
METHRGHVRVFFEHYRELTAPVRQEIRIKRDRYQNLLHSAVSEGIRDGSFREVDPDVTTMAVFGMCNWAYQWWHPGSGTDSALTAQKRWDVVIRGLAMPGAPARPRSADREPGT